MREFWRFVGSDQFMWGLGFWLIGWISALTSLGCWTQVKGPNDSCWAGVFIFGFVATILIVIGACMMFARFADYMAHRS